MLSQSVKHTCGGLDISFETMNESMGDRIRRLRESRGWPQAELARRVGVSRAAVSQWERGETANIKIRHFLVLCDEFDTTPEYLAFGPTDPRSMRRASGRR